MKNLTLFTLIFTLLCLPSLHAQRKMEKLDRGVVAIRTSPTQVYIGWRLLGNDSENIAFNIYRGSIKLNPTPLSISTNFQDNTDKNEAYTIRKVLNGIEQSEGLLETATPVLLKNYLEIPLKIPKDGITPVGEAYSYNANDCSVGDLDGDGEYEIVLKWDPSNSKDNSQSGYTGNVFLDAYKMNGRHLWRIDLGRNIRAGAHYTQFMVYDFDSDGKAEVTCRTSDGTIDGKGKVIGDSLADYRTTNGYILSGPEYQTVFNGETGAAMASVDYYPARGTVTSWGDNYGNRVDRFVDVVAYLDGKRPSFVNGRGYYTRLVRTAWNWRNGKLSKVWSFDSNNADDNNFASQGNHQITVGDMDGDGKDEICNGSSAIDDDGTGYYVNGLGHGDALHMSDLDPSRPGMEVWQCHEEPARYGAYGLEMRDAKTGIPLWGVDGQNSDVGRCMTADIDPRYRGYEMWGAKGGLYSCKGVQISTTRPSSMNFGIWWDGDLTRELLDGNKIYKWDYLTSKQNTLFTADSCTSNNGTKATPCLSADLFGDWREEFILRKSDNTCLRIFTTTIPTNNRFYTLMHDAQYRTAIAWQNSAYNQPPHPSFYLGDSMNVQPRPNIDVTSDKKITSLKDSGVQSNTTVYPNPSNNNFVVDTEGAFEYKIIDLGGRVYERGKGYGKYVIGQKISKGMYVVEISQNGEMVTFKVIKQ
jgi:rhamnogalacturonan endolyase